MFKDEIQETQPEEIEEVESEETEDTDPLDALPPEQVLAEAKKFRAIATRKKPKEEVKREVPEDVVRRSDFERANEAKAKRRLAERSDPAAKEILENWDNLAPIYGKVASRGKNSDEDIIEDLFDAHAVWKLRQPAPKVDTKEAEAEVASIAGAGGVAPRESTPKPDRIIKPSKSMNEWYS